MFREAIISECGLYRYLLIRSWDDLKPRVTFIGLNPSTGDGKEDDPTIRRMISFAQKWGYGGFFLVNLFAYRSPYPNTLLDVPDPVGPKNDRFIQSVQKLSEKIIFCWGAHKIAESREKQVIASFPDAFCFGKTKAGKPKHPLYISSEVLLLPYIQQRSSVKM